ncbi:cupin domain-containing protein [Gilvimarinus agarilyticus]|uniref:cupin domain-containing protein n=1 Tax=Gilvimarinus agarilyticus TaxID=679259 RepID=UPI000695EC57|nr:cupin domain-containing protein [Gilvimarinus agarilyticus]
MEEPGAGAPQPCNITADIPEQLPQELTQTLCHSTAVRIERIVSQGHASAVDAWYEQDEHEWVLLLSGGAVLQWGDGSEQPLAPGDYVLIPAGTRHRVAGTLASEPSIWLAVFFNQ